MDYSKFITRGKAVTVHTIDGSDLRGVITESNDHIMVMESISFIGDEEHHSLRVINSYNVVYIVVDYYNKYLVKSMESVE